MAASDPRYGLPQKNTSQFDAKTLRASHHFQKAHGLPVQDTVDGAMLRKLITTPAKTPLATRPYLTLVLDQPWTPVNKLVSVVAVAEGGGKFNATCANRDKAGLSVGIIQWAQKPGRLSELLQAWNAAEPDELSRIFGGAAKLKAVLDQAKLGKAGLNADGTSKDPNLEFTKPAFLTAFHEALVNPKLQVIQVITAGASFAANRTSRPYRGSRCPTSACRGRPFACRGRMFPRLVFRFRGRGQTSSVAFHGRSAGLPSSGFVSIGHRRGNGRRPREGGRKYRDCGERTSASRDIWRFAGRSSPSV